MPVMRSGVIQPESRGSEPGPGRMIVIMMLAGNPPAPTCHCTSIIMIKLFIMIVLTHGHLDRVSAWASQDDSDARASDSDSGAGTVTPGQGALALAGQWAVTVTDDRVLGFNLQLVDHRQTPACRRPRGPRLGAGGPRPGGPRARAGPPSSPSHSLSLGRRRGGTVTQADSNARTERERAGRSSPRAVPVCG
jgi:hypothetical protein